MKGDINMKDICSNILKAVIKISVKNSANCTTSGTIYQPKIPTELKKYSKINNDR